MGAMKTGKQILVTLKNMAAYKYIANVSMESASININHKTFS